MSDLEQTLANRPDLGLTRLGIHSRNYSSREHCCYFLSLCPERSHASYPNLVAALIFLVVEHIWTIKGEYRYIWRCVLDSYYS